MVLYRRWHDQDREAQRLDSHLCYQARTTRDAHFDGRFFAASKSTRTYCRPICRTHPAKERNCAFFVTAAAAQSAGYHPCLHCQPEHVAEFSCWSARSIDSSNTVARALSLVADGVLDGDDACLDSFAARLEVSAQHLRETFQHYLGASPIVIALLRRVLFAKQLVDETQLPIAQIAFATGFDNPRRFRDSFKRVFKRPPSALRKVVHRSPSRHSFSATQITLQLHYRPPYDWTAMLSFLAARAIDGIEKVEGQCYSRTLTHDGEIGSVAVTHCSASSCLAVQIKIPSVVSLLPIVARLRKMFDLAADVTTIGAAFAQDPLLKSLFNARPGLRVPSAWEPFELTMRAVLGQQVTLQAGRQLTQKLVQLCGTEISVAISGDSALNRLFPTAAQVANADLTSLPMPTARKRAVQELAEATLHDPHLFEARANVEQTVSRLCEIRGVGEWTAHYIAMRAVREADAFPASDVALLRSMEQLHGTRPSKERFIELAQQWRPWRAYAAQHLWTAGALHAVTTRHTR
jgi:AraC family transcriptional regulator of adaptative response / DNA-3-methyladenine glycosylase II